MFKKLFGRKETPTNEGKTGSSAKVDGVRWVKKFILVLSNMEGSPTYNLTHQLSVGSEVGNIVIADPSVSPRHCTFILQEDVVSVLDHGSIGGTFINGQKIPPGRYIILEETDSIRVGDLEVKVHVKNEAIKQGLSDEELADESEEEIEEVDEAEEEMEEPEQIVANKKSKLAFLKKWFKPKAKEEKKEEKKEVKKYVKKSTGVAFSGHSSYATNSLVRVIAVICDSIIAYILFVIFSPFDEFQSFVHDVPVMLGQLLDIDWNALWPILNDEYPFIGEMLKDFYTYFSVTFNIGPLFLLFVLTRLITTLMFGVSISEGLLGVKSYGNAFWKRTGGVLRVIIGIVTGPFLIFDIPAIVSRRTFKEFMTFTHTYVESKFITILGVILYLPLLVGVALLSPLLQGLELPEPIAINDKLDKRVRVVRPADAQVEVVKTKEISKFLNVELEFENQNISLIPFFKFSGQKKKLSYKPALVMYHKDLQRSVELEVFKTFDFKELLGIGFKGDFFLEQKFPQIEGFIHSSEMAKSAFKTKSDEKDNRKFADEVVAFTKIAFELSADNAFEFMETYTPLLKGVMEYRSSLLALIEYKGFDQIDFIKMGNAYFLRITYNRQKPFDLLIPLIKGEGRVFKVEFDKKENLGVLKNRFYKFNMEEANWFPPHEATQTGEELNPLQVLDFFSLLNMKEDKISSEKAQSLYGYYYENSANILKKDDPSEYEIWKKSVKSVFAIMNIMKDAIPKTIVKPEPPVTAPAPVETAPAVAGTAPVAPTAPAPEVAPVETIPPAEVPEDPRMKLFQNFQDLKDAVENKNKEYFGIEESVSI